MEIPNANIVVCGVPVDLRQRVLDAARAEGRTLAGEVRLLLSRTYPADSQRQ